MYHISKDGKIRPCKAKTPEACKLRGPSGEVLGGFTEFDKALERVKMEFPEHYGRNTRTKQRKRNYIKTEESVLKLFPVGKTLSMGGVEYQVKESAKPYSRHGEPKTDVYALLESKDGVKKELKISIKRSNADFVENKINAERAEAIFGENWSEVVKGSIAKLKNVFNNKRVIFPEQEGRTKKGSMTLGWKLELMNKPSGELSSPLDLTQEQVVEVYSGGNLPPEKKHSSINGRITKNSGVANYILVGDEFKDTEDVLENLDKIEEYVQEHPRLYASYKALNRRTIEGKHDGNRPLAVPVEWYEEDGVIKHRINFNKPLQERGNDSAERLLKTMEKLGMEDTRDL